METQQISATRPDQYTTIIGPIEIEGTKIGDNYYHHYLTDAEEVVVGPGQYMGFAGVQLGYLDKSYDPSEVDRLAASGFASSGAHMIRFIGRKPEMLWYENTCTAANSEVTAKLKFGVTKEVTNSTQCQDPIENMRVSTATQTTEQRSEWEPDIYLRTGEVLTFTIETDKGLPIQLNITSNGDEIENKVIADNSKYLISRFYPKIY